MRFSKRHKTMLRLVALAALMVGLYLVGRALGLTELSVPELRDRIQGTGWSGIGLYFVLFAVGELMQIPGLVFICSAAFAWGIVFGGTIAWVGSVISIITTFVIVRTVGGQPLAQIERPFVKKILGYLDRRPILTVALVRIFMIISPPITYAFAFSQVKFRDYAIGSAIGLIPPVAVFSLLVDYIVEYLL